MFTLFANSHWKAAAPGGKSSLKRQAFLFLLSCAVLTFFFLLPRNNRWLQNKPLAYLTGFFRQATLPDTEHRKRERWGASYIHSQQIARLLTQEQDRDSLLVLMPPADYFKDRKIDYPVPEPAVFYYYTGVKTIWANSPQALRANRMVRAANGAFFIDTVLDKNRLADSLLVFRKYKISL